METAQFLAFNQRKLDNLEDPEAEWAKALVACKKHVEDRLKKKTLFGAHTEERLGMDAIEYYISFAYDAILDGRWQWKDGRTLTEQMIRIADNRIGKEVEKYKTEDKPKKSVDPADFADSFYLDDTLHGQVSVVQEAVFSKHVSVIEECIRGDDDLVMFWECVKEGMKRKDIAEFMEKTLKQVDKIKEKLMNRVKQSSYFHNN